VAETAFDLTYEGDALATGRMPVRDLAPALLALGDIFADASGLVAPGRPPAALNIQATHEGSFVVRLILDGWDEIIDIFSSTDAVALEGLLGAVVGVSGLFGLIKRLRGRRIGSTVGGPEPGEITLQLDDETTLTVPSTVLTLYTNLEVRKKARQVIEPLSRGGVDGLVFRVHEEVTVSLTADDTPAFEAPSVADEPLGAQEIELVVGITSVVFAEGNKWRLSLGDRTFHAAIHDEAFLRKVKSGEEFSNGDMLRCRLRISQYSGTDGLRTEYEVLEVIDHIRRAVQLRIDETPGDPGPLPA